MRAGRLRQRVTIQSRTVAPDSVGDVIETWATVATVPAQVTIPGGAERMVSQVDQRTAFVTHKVRLRYRSDVTPLNRLLYGSRVLDIESAVDPDGRTRELVCMCTERVGEAA